MSKSPKEIYAVPEWMRQFLPLFQNTGGNDVEELLHDEDTNMFANSVRYMLIVSARSQFTLLMRMRQRLVAQPMLESQSNGINHCYRTVPAALRYLAENPRPIGGNSSYNSEHLYDLAHEIEIAACTATRAAGFEAMLARLYSECDTGERRGNGSQSGVAMPSWEAVETARLLLGVK